MELDLDEFEIDGGRVDDFYEHFEASLEDDEISAVEEGFMVGFSDYE